MSLTQMLDQGGVFSSIANELGIDEQQARAGAGALLPAIVAGMGRSSSGAASGGGLGSLIGSLGGAGMLDAVLGGSPTPVNQGNQVLGEIFGGKDTSRSVAGEAAALTGLDENLLKKMLPILAMAAAGYLANGNGSHSSSASNPLGGILGSIVGKMISR